MLPTGFFFAPRKNKKKGDVLKFLHMTEEKRVNSALEPFFLFVKKRSKTILWLALGGTLLLSLMNKKTIWHLSRSIFLMPHTNFVRSFRFPIYFLLDQVHKTLLAAASCIFLDNKKHACLHAAFCSFIIMRASLGVCIKEEGGGEGGL